MYKKSVSGPNRRHVLTGIGASIGAIASVSHSVSAKEEAGFHNGVASGDPLQNSVILWSRYFGKGISGKNITGEWQISLSNDFNEITNQGTFKTGPAKDFTIKIDATGLTPDTEYYYRFVVEDTSSPIGKTRTLPATTNQVKLAVVSCSNYPQGYFHVYRELSKKQYAAVLHLGDYIYEYADGKYDNDLAKQQGRKVKPKTEIISLDDYRTRYALYRSDPDLQAVHAAHPFICVWDDHEVANDTWKEGAENHNEGEGDFNARRNAAMRAYYEWMPIRDNASGDTDTIYRTFELGNLASLIMLDTRNIGRDRGFDYQKDLPYQSIPFDFRDQNAPKAVLDPNKLKDIPKAAIKFIPVPFDLTGKKPVPMTDFAKVKAANPKKLPKGFSYLPDIKKFSSEMLGSDKRTLLGTEQEAWLLGQLKTSKQAGKPWQILGQQVLSGKLGMPMLADEDLNFKDAKFLSKEVVAFMRMLGKIGMPLNLDAWDGYPAARERAFQDIKLHANNAVFLAGDTHNAWAFELKDKTDSAVAVELGTPGVSSPGLESYIPADPAIVEKALHKASPELKYMNGKDRGWLELSITADNIQSDWFYVSSVLKPEYTAHKGKTLTSKAGSHTFD